MSSDEASKKPSLGWESPNPREDGCREGCGLKPLVVGRKKIIARKKRRRTCEAPPCAN